MKPKELSNAVHNSRSGVEIMVVSKQDKPQNLTGPPAQGAQGMPPQVKILQMMNAYRLSQLISVAAKLGIADILADGLKEQ